MKIALRICMLLLLTCWSIIACAELQVISNVNSVEVLSNGVELAVDGTRVRVMALAPNVVRLRYTPSGSTAIEDSFAVLPNAFPNAVKVQAKESAAAITLDTGALQIRILKSPLRILFLDLSGQVISQDQPGDPVIFNGHAFRVRKSMPIDEHYFGLGDKAGPIDHRDQAFTMWNTDAFGWVGGSDPLYKSIPFFLGVRKEKAYGIFLDNTYRSSFEFGKESRDAFSFGSEDGPLDYYFIYGPEPKTVLQSYTALVGRTPLPPRYVLGYQQSRYSYFPEARVREVARTLREHKIPCDVIYLDIDYQDGNRPFTIDRKLFPNFEGMVHDLGEQGFKMVTITDLHIKKETGYRPYDEGEKYDLFVKNSDGSDYVGKVWPGDSVFPDFTRAQARQWWGTLYSDFVKMGVRGFWNDMNEPAVFRYPEKTMPLDTVHSIEGRKTDHREVHNIYGMQNVRATYEGLLHLTPNQRPFVLTRAAFAGTQRYAATWTGDNGSTWEHLRLTVPTLLSLGISGYPLAGADVGGFDGSPTPEVLTRWTEVGAFQPLFRNHAAKGTRDHEPWVDGPGHEAVRKRFIEERYRLMPYIYSSMEETSRTGVPLMRPMFLEFPNQENLQVNDKEFMFGADLLVAPKSQDTVGAYEVTFPDGPWYDYWTGLPVQGHPFRVDPALSELPVYVRGGAILPRQAVVQNVEQTPPGPLELVVYAGPNCRGSLYTDDGYTLNYTRGEYFRQQFTCSAKDEKLSVHISSAQGSYPAWWKTVQVKVFGAMHVPKNATVDGKTVTEWHFDERSKSITLDIPTSASDVTLNY